MHCNRGGSRIDGRGVLIQLRNFCATLTFDVILHTLNTKDVSYNIELVLSMSSICILLG